ncbi:MAG: hypothetical protein AAF243_17060 [Cyanobacteria bacterium P01_A01_bin.137]
MMLSKVRHWLSCGKPTSSTLTGSTDGDAVKDCDIETTWHTWFDDNLDEFYTADLTGRDQPLSPNYLINVLLDNNVTVWHHRNFASWLSAEVEQVLYIWPKQMPILTRPQPKWVKDIQALKKIRKACRSLPAGFENNVYVQSLMLAYMGASYRLIEQLLSNDPDSKRRHQQHEEKYGRRTAFFEKHGMTAAEYARQRLQLPE